MPDILHRVGIKAAPEKVYNALTEHAGLAGWWTKETDAEPRVGAVLEFRFRRSRLKRHENPGTDSKQASSMEGCGRGQGMNRN